MEGKQRQENTYLPLTTAKFKPGQNWLFQSSSQPNEKKKHGSAEVGVDLLNEKEEHLLPPPYQTDCKDNGPSENAEESISPNSYQVCLDLCRSEYAKTVSGCSDGMPIVSSDLYVCIGEAKTPNISEEQLVELQDKQLNCFQNCKQGCLKLQCKYRIIENKLSW
ncbi:hypothetical protein AVEN_137906-1, partial [Araneus ventricosus]